MLMRVQRRAAAVAVVVALAAAVLTAAPISAATLTAPPSTLLTQGIQIGAYAPPSPYDGGLTGVEDLESTLGRRMDIINWYKKWGDASGQFTTTPGGTLDQLRTAGQSGRVPTITWEPWTSGDTMTSDFMPATITAGAHDDYITSWADGLKTYGDTVYLRPMHEMNGVWYPWSAQTGVQTAADYVAAWRHIVDVFRARGATNVKWVWSVNNIDFPASNKLENYWPGSSYVDVLGFDAYNGTSSNVWKSFTEIAQPVYDRLAALDPNLPIWINELGSAEPTATMLNAAGHTKAEWFVDMLNTSGMPRLDAIVLFNEGRDPYDWTVTSSPSSAPALRNALSQAAGWVAPPAGAPTGSKLPAPTGFTAVRSSAQATLDWNPVAGANGYVVLRNGTPAAYTLSTEWIDSGLPTSTTYTYSVAAVRGGTRGLTSDPLSPAPAALYLSATARGTQISLTWTATAGETYQLLRDGAVIATRTAAASTDTFTDVGRTANTRYVYQVRSTANAARTSDPVTVRSAPAAPAATPSDTTYMSKAALTWPVVAGAATYQVFKSGVLSATIPAPATGPVTFVQEGVTPGTSTSFTVTAVNSDGASSTASPVTVWTTPGIPTDVAVTSTAAGLALTWSPVTSATGYAIYRDGSTSVLKQSSGTSFTDTNVTLGQVYSYTVRAISTASGVARYSPASATVTATATMVSAPTNVKASPSSTGVTVSWTAVPGADSYTVSEGGIKVATVDGATLSVTDMSVAANTTLTYVVTAANGPYVSASASVSVLTAPAAAAVTAGSTRYTAKAQIRIAAVPGAVSYLVTRNGSPLATLPASTTVFTDTGLLSASSYRYIVTAVNAAGTKSAASAPVTVWTLPLPPASLAATFVRGTGTTLTWTAVNRATSYLVYVGTSTSAGKFVAQVATPGVVTFSDKSSAALAPGTTVTYWVQAVRDIGTEKLFSAKTMLTVTAG